MSLFNTASCGPSTALQKLNNFSNDQKNVSANTNQSTYFQQQQNSNTLKSHQNNGFMQNHLNTINNRLENDFGSFVNSPGTHSMASMPSTSLTSRPGDFGTFASVKNAGTSVHSPDWISEFSRVKLNDSMQQSRQQQNQHQPLPSQQRFNYQKHVANVAATTSAYGSLSGANHVLNNGMSLQNQIPVFQNMAEHQQLHRGEHLKQQQIYVQESNLTEDELFNQAFEMIEQELDQEIIEEQNTQNLADPDDLSSIAASISMSLKNISDTSENVSMQDKIINSSFLKLMHDISAKQVALGENGFVSTETGDYVGSNSHELNEQKNIEENVEQIEEQLDHTHTLPDPLDFLKSSDDYKSSDQLRNLINSRSNGDDILPKHYDDIYDEYKVGE